MYAKWSARRSFFVTGPDSLLQWGDAEENLCIRTFERFGNRITMCYLHTHTNTHTNTHAHAHTHTHTNTNTQTRTYTQHELKSSSTTKKWSRTRKIFCHEKCLSKIPMENYLNTAGAALGSIGNPMPDFSRSLTCVCVCVVVSASTPECMNISL